MKTPPLDKTGPLFRAMLRVLPGVAWVPALGLHSPRLPPMEYYG